MLVNLRYLNLQRTFIPEMPSGILPKLSQLQVLKFNCWPETIKLNGEEIVSLMKLECFEGGFYGANDFNKYVGSLEEGGPSHYQFFVREEMTGEIAYDLNYWENKDKCIVLDNCDISQLPKDVQTIVIYKCDNLRSSSDAPYLKYASELKSICICKCEEIEDVFSYSYTFPLQTIEFVYPKGLDKLQVLFREEKVASLDSPLVIPPGTFSYLKKFSIFGCGNIKKLFTLGLLLNLTNLEEFKVYNCQRLEEIIAAPPDDVDEEIEKEGKDNTIFPRLRRLVLYGISRLETICSSSTIIVCDSLEYIEIGKCPKLKRLPLSLRLIDGQLSSPPSSLRIIVEKECWELLEWDNHDTKNALEPL